MSIERSHAENALGLAISVFTLAHEDRGTLADQSQRLHDLAVDEEPLVLANALSFVCKQLSNYMSVEDLIAAKGRVLGRLNG